MIMEENNTLRSQYRVLQDVVLIIECHEGHLTLDNMIQFRKEQQLDRNFSPELDILMDLRKVEISGDPGEVNDYVNFYKENEHFSGNRRIAVLTDTPNQVFYTTLFEQFSKMLNQRTKIFSTVEASLNWLNVNISKQQVDLIIGQLRKALQEGR